MARVKDNIMAKGFSGTIGKQLTFRQIGGQTFVSKYQKAPSVPATEKKRAAQTKFGWATAYARIAVKDPELKALYQAVVTGGQRAFNIAVIDALKAPVIESIQADLYQGRVGDPIIVRATDDFKVAGVIVSIYRRTGELIERGNAAVGENEQKDWFYYANQSNPEKSGTVITVIATDLPGNNASLSILIS